MKKTNFKFIIILFLFTVFSSHSLISQEEPIPVQLNFNINQSCFNLLSGWDAHLLRWDNVQTGIDWYNITTTNAGSIFTTSLRANYYYWAIDGVPPLWSCWGTLFEISQDGGTYSYSFDCNQYSNCLSDNNDDKFKNNNLKPESFVLSQNYPNPFNPTTLISYELPKSTFVKLVIYDILGKEIKVLINEYQEVGKYIIPFDGTDFSSGVYIYKIETDQFTNSKKMFLKK